MFKDFFKYAKAATIKQYFNHKGISISKIPWLGGFANAQAALIERINAIEDFNLRNTVTAELNDICAMACDRGHDNLFKRISDPKILELYGQPYDLAAIVFIHYKDIFLKAKKATGLAMPVYCINNLANSSCHLKIYTDIGVYEAKILMICYESYDGTNTASSGENIDGFLPADSNDITDIQNFVIHRALIKLSICDIKLGGRVTYRFWIDSSKIICDGVYNENHKKIAKQCARRWGLVNKKIYVTHCGQLTGRSIIFALKLPDYLEH